MGANLLDLAQMVQWFAAAFAISIAGAHFIAKFRVARNASILPEPGSTVRFRCDNGMFRAKFLGVSESGWRISAPLSRGIYEPLHIGQDVIVEAVHQRGALIFRSAIVGRVADPHEFVLRKPTDLKPRERRSSGRRVFEKPEPVTVDSRDAFMLNLSSGGARLRCLNPISRGERIRLDVDSRTFFGWVLDAETAGFHTDVRMRFETLFG